MSPEEIDFVEEKENVADSEDALAVNDWKGDVRVQIGSVKDTAAQRITCTIPATNLGDGDARHVIISHTPSYVFLSIAISFASVSASSTTCQGGFAGVAPSVVYNPVTLGVGASETVTVIINNPGNPARPGTAQARGSLRIPSRRTISHPLRCSNNAERACC